MTTQPHPHLRVETAGEVRTLTLTNAARRNAQTPSLWMVLAEQARSVPDDVRVVVIRGEGTSFSAGIDVGMFSPGGVQGEASMPGLVASGRDRVAAQIGEWQQGFALWSQCPAVVIAQVHGHAIGAGFQLALAADLRVVADDTRFAMRETTLGLVPDLAGTKPLLDLVGFARALEICATGRPVAAQEAERLGLANVVAPVDQLGDATRALVDSLLAVPDAALRALKQLLRGGTATDLATQMKREREAQPALLEQLMAGHAP